VISVFYLLSLSFERILPKKQLYFLFPALVFLETCPQFRLSLNKYISLLKYLLSMALEPVHMHKISELAERIDRSFELDESKTAADIYSLLEELKIDGKVILKAVDRLFRGVVRTELMAQGDDSYSVTYACGSGSTNPKTYDSGLFVDFCHCGLAATPIDLDVQRCRTIVCVAY
jgi:hypothetical protein